MDWDHKKVSDTFLANWEAWETKRCPTPFRHSNARVDTGADTSATLGSASEWIPMKRCNFAFVAKQDSLFSLSMESVSLCNELIHNFKRRLDHRELDAESSVKI